MVKVPHDLYPNATGVEGIIEEYLDLGAKAFKDYFSGKLAYVEYMEKLERREDAEDLLEAGSYLYLIKNEATTSVRVVLFISLIEKISSKNYTDFASWFNSEEGRNIFDSLIKKEKLSASEVKNIIRSLAEIHRQTYGARNNFANFVELYVSKGGQGEIISPIRKRLPHGEEVPSRRD